MFTRTGGQGGVAVARRSLADPSIGEVLRLLSAGAPGEILLALREGSMQTKVLTHSVKGYTPRTIYRYLSKLAEIDLVERDDSPDGSARVAYALRKESGEELAALIDRFAAASMTRLPGGQIDSTDWTALGLLADLWEAGVVEALSQEPTSPTELARSLGALSYHQLNRRANRFKACGFFSGWRQSRQQRQCYALTAKVRRTMGLVVGVGRWRQRHSPNAGAGLTTAEMGTALRALLPLAKVPRHAGKGARLRIEDLDSRIQVWVEVAGDGTVDCRKSVGARLDAWAGGEVEEWTTALLDGGPWPAAGGDADLVGDCLDSLYKELWKPGAIPLEKVGD
jgi:DNA-binding HxlR family transcriptional regulator